MQSKHSPCRKVKTEGVHGDGDEESTTDLVPIPTVSLFPPVYAIELSTCLPPSPQSTALPFALVNCLSNGELLR